MKAHIARFRGALFIAWCRFFRKNIRIGKGLQIHRKFAIRGKGSVVIGNDCRVDGIIGDRRQYSCIDTGGRASSVVIGNNARLYASRIWAKFSIHIGSEVLIEDAGIVDTDFHAIDKQRSTPPPHENAEKCRVLIGNRVCIGVRSVITKGVTIGDDAVIAPGSIVSRSVPARYFACGNPAKITGPIENQREGNP